jgi:hypothetical protein
MAAFLFRSALICSLLSACIAFGCRVASALDSYHGDRVCSSEPVVVKGQHPPCCWAIHDIITSTPQYLERTSTPGWMHIPVIEVSS